MPESEAEREAFIELMQVFGEALFFTIKAACQPSQGGSDIARNSWAKFGKAIVNYKEAIDD